MVRISTLLITMTLAFGCSPPSTRMPTSDPAAELRSLTEQRFAANAENDRVFYEKLLAPNFLSMIPHHPAQTRAEYLAHEFGERTGPIEGPQVKVTEFRAQIEGDTAIVSYRVAEPTPVGDQVFEVRTWRVDTYLRKANAWRLLSMAMAEIPSWPDVADVDPGLYAEYAGTYRLAPNVEVVVTHEAGHLMAAMTGQAKTELFPESETTFFDRTDSPLARTIFERDSTGRVVAQVYRSNGQKLRATKLPS